MALPPLHSRSSDAALARQLAAGDGAAFATLDARYRRALTRYARSLLRRSEHDAEDVVQDVLIRAHTALRDGDGPDELRPWLYRLTRNRAIDEVRRGRWGEAALNDADDGGAAAGEDPAAVLRRRTSLRRLVDDLADLPPRQRTALLARELDGQRPAEVAAQLGVSVPAAQMLATRARENLLKARAAHDADHADIRAALLDAHEHGVRASEHALRHVKECDACRAYRRRLRRLSRQLQGLNPAIGLPLIGAGAKLVSSGGLKAAAGVAAGIAVVATGGVVVLRSDVHRSGDPAPFRLTGVRDLEGHRVPTGAPLPGRTAVVTALVQIPAGRRRSDPLPSVTLACPDGMRFGGYVEPQRRLPLDWQGARGTILGTSTKVLIDLSQRDPRRAVKGTIGIVCKRPQANGSISDTPRRLRRGEQLAHICTDRVQVRLFRTPGRDFYTSLFGGEPVAIQRRTASGSWTLVGHDSSPRDPIGARPGWIRTGKLCA